MKRQRFLASWIGAVLGTFCALLLVAQAQGSDQGKLTEEFHKTYPLDANGRVELDNINGSVTITAWARNEVKVDAIKSAYRQERLNEAKIVVDSSQSHIYIHTEYPGHNHTWTHDSEDNPASVEYTIVVPKTVRLDEIKLINGSLDVQGVTGEVRANCINGRLAARGLTGRAELSTINGTLDAQYGSLGQSTVELSSVNGRVELTLPSDAKAEVEASTVSGSIHNDFGLHVNNHQFVGHDLRGELGGGGTRIKLSNVNGSIDIRHAGDGRAISPAKDMGGKDDDDDDDQI